MLNATEQLVFAHRGKILGGLLLFTAFMFYWAVQLKPDAGFEKQLPQGHEYVETHYDHVEFLGGGSRALVVVRARDGNIWTPKFLQTLFAVTDDLFYLKGVDRGKLTSLWTPNTRFIEVNEDGLYAENLIPGTITPAEIDDQVIEDIQNKVVRGGFTRRLVSSDFSSALIAVQLLEYDPKTQEKLDILDIARRLESDIRGKYQDDTIDIHIIGLAKMFGDVADSATAVVKFFGFALALTALSVYLYSRSIILTALPLFCSLCSVIWQFGILKILGYGLDPLAILVPFLVFAIGVSHGIQQINLISDRITTGSTSLEAARASFSRLLIPGSMALLTDLIGFGTLWLVPIGMIKELAITASIGVALKIVTNLLMLPLAASYFKFDAGYKDRITTARRSRDRLIQKLAFVTRPRWAIVVLVVSAALLGIAIDQSGKRHVGDLHPGSPLLKQDHRYNVDSRYIAESFSFGFDVLVVINETPSETCINYEPLHFMDQMAWQLENTQGVTSTLSASSVIKQSLAIWMEANPKFRALPRNQQTLVLGGLALAPSTGLINDNCTVMPVLVFLEDHKAVTIQRVINAVKAFRDANEMVLRFDGESWHALEQSNFLAMGDDVKSAVRAGEYVLADDQGALMAMGEEVATASGRNVKKGALKNINIRLASGNAGLIGASNEAIEEAELPMLLLVYGVIIFLVMATYRDWRATICCCLPLTMATFLGYWFMNLLGIGLSVSTMPVMVLAVGIGVDYAFYIFNRLQVHLHNGLDMAPAYRRTLSETGIAVVFTAVTLAIGVSTWVFSDLKFQADMGALLTFMFLANMVGAITLLPALAIVLERVFPRKPQLNVRPATD